LKWLLLTDKDPNAIHHATNYVVQKKKELDEQIEMAQFLFGHFLILSVITIAAIIAETNKISIFNDFSSHTSNLMVVAAEDSFALQ
jgi:hypothetical protein